MMDDVFHVLEKLNLSLFVSVVRTWRVSYRKGGTIGTDTNGRAWNVCRARCLQFDLGASFFFAVQKMKKEPRA